MALAGIDVDTSVGVFSVTVNDVSRVMRRSVSGFRWEYIAVAASSVSESERRC